MYNLCRILQHIVDGFDDVSLAQHHPVIERYQLVFMFTHAIQSPTVCHPQRESQTASEICNLCLRFTPLLSSSKFPAFSASRCLQNSSIIQNNSVTLQSVVISNKFVTCYNSPTNAQNIFETTNFL